MIMKLYERIYTNGEYRFKLSDKDITTLMSRISFDTENLPQGMKARAKYQNTTVNIYQSGKVMFQGNHAEAVSQELLPQHSQLNTNKTKKKIWLILFLNSL